MEQQILRLGDAPAAPSKYAHSSDTVEVW